MHFEIVRQVSIALENHPGALHRAAAELARHGINIHGLAIVDNVEQAVVRLRTSDAARAKDVLREVGLKLTEADVFEFDLPDKPGRLAEVCRALADGDVNIDYAYGTSHASVQRMRVLLKASPVERAKKILQQLPPE